MKQLQELKDQLEVSEAEKTGVKEKLEDAMKFKILANEVTASALQCYQVFYSVFCWLIIAVSLLHLPL